MTKRWGATPEEWALLDFAFDLTSDLLPVVSNPHGTISGGSSLKTIGKVPSLYNSSGLVVGMSKWTLKRATSAEVDAWSQAPDYGICLQTRHVRGLDIDLSDAAAASAVVLLAEEMLGFTPPKRYRANSAKCLLAFRIDGEHPKRKLTAESGIIEFLANGQQFVAAGTHPSGERYQWDWNDHEDFPTITIEQFDALWTEIEKRFAIAKTEGGKLRERGETIDKRDPRVPFLLDHPNYLGQGGDGQLLITCPFKDEHTGESGETETVYFPAGTNGYPDGHYKCMHAHCMGRGDLAFDSALGLHDNDFDELPVDTSENTDPFDFGGSEKEEKEEKPLRFLPVPASEYLLRPRPTWLIKGIVPKSELVVLYGESTAGKSFVAIDMGMAIARGLDWVGRKTEQGRVVYIAAEGAGGFRNRLEAYGLHHGVDLAGIPFDVVADCPNLLSRDDAVAVAKAAVVGGKVSVIVVDTFAQTTAGSNENAGEDMGKALAHCKGIHRATGATILLVSHMGKDLTKGIRGWSGVKAAADASIEITREDEVRTMRLDKVKDGEDGEAWGFKLQTVDLFAEDDEEASSCVITFEGAVNGKRVLEGRGKPKAAPKPQGIWQEKVVNCYLKLVGDCVNREVERKVLWASTVTKSIEDTGAPKFQWRYRDRANDAIEGLIRRGIFVITKTEKGEMLSSTITE